MSPAVIAFRAADYETPLWAFPNLSSGRYNVGGRPPATQYLSLHPMTPWAELLRNLDLRDGGAASELRVAIWVIRLELEDVPVEITFDNVARYSLAPEDLVSDDRAACQRLARALDDLGVGAFTAPSAALPGATNLVVLHPAIVIDFDAKPIDPAFEWPTALVSRDGRSPEGLWDAVHHRGAGTRHPALVAWETGESFRFEQPAVELRG